ncbi:MAG: hypothetical protein JNJ57_00180 [Saprospiraceae bacterium]|nr:hypothetical protein [Saprospiraceae bacterium]
MQFEQLKRLLRRKKTPDIFERLEQEASNELHLLEELGPQTFGTDHLMELHGQVCERIMEQQRLVKIAIAVGAAGAGWFLLGTAAQLIGYQLLGFVAFGLAALCLLSFLGAAMYIFRKYRTKGHLDHTRLSIEDELRSRRDRQRKKLEDW